MFFKTLHNLAKKNNLTIVENINYDEKSSYEINEEIILNLICEISSHFSGKCIIYGGHLASPYIYGSRQVRNLSSDIDVYIGELSIKELSKKLTFKEKKLSYDKKNNTLFVEIEGIFITFSYYSVGDFKLPEEFFYSKRTIKLNKNKVYVCSPEFLILMKLRRSFSYKKIFGKDVIDIGNVLISYKKGKIILDLQNLKKIVEKYFYSREQLVNFLYDVANFEENSFNKSEKKIVMESMLEIIKLFE
ncbi:MAG: nucleotidyltransferase [Candidatus Woesearchaeota archaeon]